MTFNISVSLVLIGFSVLTGQIVLMRELFVVFYGNELSAAAVLSSWLVWSAIGSFCSGLVADALKRRAAVFSLIQAALALLFPISLLMARLSKTVWQVPIGETVAFDQMLAISFTVLAPFCFLAGFLFALGCRLYADSTCDRDRSVGSVYWLDALGSGAGGVVFAGVLVNVFNHVQTSLLISAALLFSSVRYAASGTRFERPAGRLGWALAAGVLGLAWIAGGSWETISREWQWQGGRLLAAADTHYGNLAAVERDNEISFYKNGLWMFTHPDPLSAEKAVHFALLTHPAPERALLIGGGLSGSLAEMLKHPSIRKVDYVELDPGFVEFGRAALPQKAVSVLDDPRVNLILTDGRRYLSTAETVYDVVIVDLPDPKTAQLNRFYTLEFFRETQRVLAPSGLMAVSLTSSESIIGPTLAHSLSSLYRTLKTAYPHVTVLPGSTALFIGSRSAESVHSDAAVLSGRIAARKLELVHVRDYYIAFNLSAGRVSYLSTILERIDRPRINRDLHPSCYYYDLVHWSSFHAPWIAALLRYLEGSSLSRLAAGPALIAALMLAAGTWMGRGPRRKSALILSCFISGFSGMVFNVLMILVFQVFYGSLYYRVAVLITLYMVGGAVGSRCMIYLIERIRRLWKTLVLVQAAMGAYAVCLLAAVNFLHGAHPGIRLSFSAETGFGFGVFLAGFLGGLHFPMAGKLYAGAVGKPGRTGGILYGLDLGGAALGAVCGGLMLLPVFGIPGTLVLLFFWNILAALILAVCPAPFSSSRSPL